MDGLLTTGLTDYQNVLRTLGTGAASKETSVVGTKENQFSSYLTNAVDQLNQKTAVMDQDTVNLITGDESDLGNVMIRMTEAQLALQTAVQVRNKCLEAYNDVKNMQFSSG
jgi:flagellar hook-basal body complex protein FliE